MIHGPTTPLEERTNRDIIVTMIAFLVFGSIIVIGTLSITLPGGNVFTTIWGIGGASFAAGIVIGSIRTGMAELRRRRRGDSQNQTQQSPRYDFLRWSSWASLALPFVAYILCSEASTGRLFLHSPSSGQNVGQFRFDAFVTSAIMGAFILSVTVAFKQWRLLLFPLASLILTYLFYVQAAWFTTFFQ